MEHGLLRKHGKRVGNCRINQTKYSAEVQSPGVKRHYCKNGGAITSVKCFALVSSPRVLHAQL